MAVRTAKRLPANKFFVDDEDFPIMRYRNFSKYVYIFTTKNLYIPCSQKLNDRLEGILPIRNAKKAVEQFYSKGATYLKISPKKW